MKKPILFVLPGFDIGGTTVSTRNLLSLLQKDGYECWVMPLWPRGAMYHLYDGVNRVELPFTLKAFLAPSLKEIPTLVDRLLAAAIRFLCNHSARFERWILGKGLNKVISEYHIDTIIAEQENFTTQLVSFAKCDNKVAWIRCDYKRYFEDRQFKKEGFYQEFNSIVCVADQACTNFKAIYPEYVAKTYCIPNPQDSELISIRANIGENEPRFIKNGKTLVSIGRFDVIKRFDQIAPIARKLVDGGLKFRWYLIGDGEERKKVSEAIRNYDMEEYVVMLGVKTNPYYYLKNADLFVCLSASEACPRVVNEAKILHTPTISTDFPTIYEFIENGVSGIIAPLEDIPAAILRLFDDAALYNRIKDNISSFSFDNTTLLNEIKRIL